MNDDWFVFDAPPSDVLRRPTIGIFDADVPLDITLFDASRQQEQTWSGVRKLTIRPQPRATHYLKIAAAMPTRYRISVMMAIDTSILPPPLQEMPVFKLPDWWLDPALKVKGPVGWFAVDVNNEQAPGDAIAFARTEPGLRLELHDQQGNLVRQGRIDGQQISISTRDLAAGGYLLRVSFKADRAASSTHTLKLDPPLR